MRQSAPAWYTPNPPQEPAHSFPHPPARQPPQRPPDDRPRTTPGKQKVAQHAVEHGLDAWAALLPALGETADSWDAHRAAVVAGLDRFARQGSPTCFGEVMAVVTEAPSAADTRPEHKPLSPA